MTFRRIAVAAFSGILLAGLAAASADAATHRRHSTAQHHAMSAQHHRSTAVSTRAPRNTTLAQRGRGADPERSSVDQLNDQSLQRARGAQ